MKSKGLLLIISMFFIMTGCSEKFLTKKVDYTKEKELVKGYKDYLYEEDDRILKPLRARLRSEISYVIDGEMKEYGEMIKRYKEAIDKRKNYVRFEGSDRWNYMFKN